MARVVHGFLCALLALAIAQGPALGADPATVWGFLLDAAGQPAAGARLLVEDQVLHALFTSGPTDMSGHYSLTLPSERSYRLVGALAPNGTRAALVSDAPVNARAGGRYRVDARFQPAAAERGGTASKGATNPAQVEGKPWYKRPAGITALVVVHLGAAAVLLGGESSASPY